MAPTPPTTRHFTSTGYIVHRDAVLLHWHRKLKTWLPPGGHIEPDEDPVQAVVREACEETGIEVTVVPTTSGFRFAYPTQIPPPLAVLEEDIADPVIGPHRHIDFIYLLRPVQEPPETIDGWRWVGRPDLEACAPIESPEGGMVAPPEDVAELGLRALEAAKGWS
jgi:8-oxo-dGTP pyrophosphatase MutT (NUDIX family)